MFVTGCRSRLAHVKPALSLLALLLSGCALAPSDSKDVTLPKAATAPQTLTADYPKAPKGLSPAPVPAQWWSLFNDPTLTALESRALKRNLSLKTAAAKVAQSQAQLGLTRSDKMPHLGAYAGYSRSALSGNDPLERIGASSKAHDTWRLGLQASWELDLWGYLDHLEDAAKSQLAASIYGQDAVRLSLSAQVANSYLLLRGAQQQLAVAEQQSQVSQQLLALTESRHRNGVATDSDIDDAKAALASVKAQLPPLKQRCKELKSALALLLDLAPGELDSTLASSGETLLPLPSQLPVGVPSELARRRPDILIAEAKLHAAVAKVGAAHADFYPRISLTGDIGTQSFELHNLKSWESRQFSIGPTLYLPIFEGGRLRRNLALSQASEQIAALNYQQTVLGAWHEVDNALSAIDNSKQSHQQLANAYLHQQQALKATRFAEQQGAADKVAVLRERQKLLGSQAALNDATTASALSVVSLYRALGSGWPAQSNKLTAKGGSHE
ncbi:efflux transporter outer membrane subunit [Gallaecimonas mangrovi]|uniref:efflux transporter outer membrane subunit n=1 Tax=Gallaecimonas mangrovi TaxID=2291597 RepID=UPI000E2073DE|nr:efflux transporter outer membrane subunit [Gallaecimonas mangrovi]